MQTKFLEELQARRIHLSRMIESEGACLRLTKGDISNIENLKEERDKIDTLLSQSSLAVPYQLCPKCNGQGTVSKPPYVPGDVNSWTSSEACYQCDVCHGGKIIPMSKPEA